MLNRRSMVAGLLGLAALLTWSGGVQAALTTEDIEATRSIVDHVQQWIGYTAYTTGSYPATIPDSFFPGGEIVRSPIADAYAAESGVDVPVTVHVESDATKEHPTVKIMNATSPSWWYNPQTGWFQARVPSAVPLSQVLADYNEVGGFAVPLTTFTQTVSGLGSAPFQSSPPVIPEPAAAMMVLPGLLCLLRRPLRSARSCPLRSASVRSPWSWRSRSAAGSSSPGGVGAGSCVS